MALNTYTIWLVVAKGVGRKFSKGEGAMEKTRPKNSTIKPPSTLSVSCMKIQGGYGPPCRTPWVGATRHLQGDGGAEKLRRDPTDERLIRQRPIA